MTNLKHTKKALLTSVLSLLLCFTMLLGTTYAWFTDSVSSANNIITAGNLDVSLEYYDNGAWVDVQDSSEIFDRYALWEPGYTKVVYLKVENVGSLALKYKLGVNIESQKPGVNKVGDDFLLSNYIYFDVVEMTNFATYADRAAAMRDTTQQTLISAGYSKFGTLNANDAPVYLAMIVYMPESVGDVANHNGLNVPEIELGINIFATQFTTESDSFDEYYDGGSNWLGSADYSWYDSNATEVVIGNAEQLAGLAAIVNGVAVAPVATLSSAPTTIQDDFANVTIKLASDIDLNNLPWTPIGNWDNPFAGTFDGQGHTIYNLNINDPTGEGIGFIGVAQGSTIKGLTLHNVKINAYSMVAGVVGAAYPASISDCHVSGNVEIVAEWAYVAGIAGYCYYGTQVDGCSVIAESTGLIKSVIRNAVGGITAWLLEGNHKVTNCDVKNLNLVGWTNVGGITGFVHYKNTIEGCSVENVTLTKTRADGNPGIGLIAGGWSYSASNAITLRNNTVKNATLEGTHIPYAAYNELYGSEYGGATTTNFVLDNNTPENITNNLVEVEKLADGIVKNGDVYQIFNANGLKYFSAKRISGKYELIADIDLAGAEISAMIVNRGDSATFNGNGYTISNAKVVSGADDNTTGQASVFYAYPNATLNVSDLTLKDITVTAEENDTGYAAAVVGYCEGTAVLNNVDVVNAMITGSKSSGLLVGHLSGSLNATNCDVTGTVKLTDYENGGHYAGEYVGTMAGNITLTDCTVNAILGGNLKSVNAGIIYGRKVSGKLTVNGIETVVVATAEALQSALNNITGEAIVILAADITGNVVIPQNALDITLDGKGHTMNGFIDLNGTSNKTIKNITLNAAYAGAARNGAGTGYRLGCIVSGGDNKPTVGARNIVIDGCTFTGSFTEGYLGAAIVLADQKRSDGFSGNITIKNCTFDTENSAYDINTYYAGAGANGYGDFIIENNVFKTENVGGPIYLGKYASSTPVIVRNNTFETVDSQQNAMHVQDHSSYGVSINAEGNTYLG